MALVLLYGRQLSQGSSNIPGRAEHGRGARTNARHYEASGEGQCEEHFLRRANGRREARSRSDPIMMARPSDRTGEGGALSARGLSGSRVLQLATGWGWKQSGKLLVDIHYNQHHLSHNVSVVRAALALCPLPGTSGKRDAKPSRLSSLGHRSPRVYRDPSSCRYPSPTP